MPFSIHCSGNDHFLYAQGHVSTIGDVFDIETAMGRLGGGVTAPLQTAAEETRDAVLPDYDALQAGMVAQDTMINRGLLDQALTLAMTRMSSLHIAVSARNPGWISSDQAFASVMLYQGDSDCAFEFLRAVGPALVQTSLNGGAVLGQIARAVTAFDATGCAALPGHGAPAPFTLLFQLSVI